MDNLRKTCTRCLVNRPIDEFYKKGRRVDASCKSCKKANVVEMRIKKRLASIKPDLAPTAEIKGENGPERIIEPRNTETNRLVNTIDFSDIGQLCGKQLTRTEKHDAISRFNEFIAILLDGYSELKGGDVYIKS